MRKQINFDMDGTIANLYKVNGWLQDLQNHNARPYKEAEPMLNLQNLARLLNRLQKQGYRICIVSWLAKNSTEEYDEEVTRAKREWLAKHLASVKWNEINIVKYGTPKETIGQGILFDDEEQNRTNWKGEAHNEKEIIETLKRLR